MLCYQSLTVEPLLDIDCLQHLRHVMKSRLMPPSSIVGVLLWLLLLLCFSWLFPVVSEVLQRIQRKEERGKLGSEMCQGVADANESVNEELRDGRVSRTVSVSPHCEKLAGAEPLALRSGGDFVIGGLFPLHYVASQPMHSYQNKPQLAPCSG